MEFARFEFQMSRRDKAGVSYREKLQFLGVPIESPPLPLGTEHLWEWFRDLDTGRTGSGFGMNPLTFSEISAWCALTGNAPTPWEVSMLKLLDACYLTEMIPGDGA